MFRMVSGGNALTSLSCVSCLSMFELFPDLNMSNNVLKASPLQKQIKFCLDYFIQFVKFANHLHAPAQSLEILDLRQEIPK